MPRITTRKRLTASAMALSLAIGSAALVSGDELNEEPSADTTMPEDATVGLEIAISARELGGAVLQENGDEEDELEPAEDAGSVEDARQAAENVAAAAEKVAENVAGTPAEGIADAAVAAAAEKVAANVENAIARANAGQAGQGDEEEEE